MALEKLAFGGEEIQYDTLPGLLSRFGIGNRDIAGVNGSTAIPRSDVEVEPVVEVLETTAVHTEVHGAIGFICETVHLPTMNTLP